MIICLGISPGDIGAAQRLLRWIERLGGIKDHALVIVADAAVQPAAIDLLRGCTSAFAETRFHQTPRHVHGWPDGPNSLFVEAAAVAKSMGEPFLWLEPDCVPLCRDWVGRIDDEYARLGPPIMAFRYQCNQPGLPRELCSGIAVYPADAADKLTVPDRCPWAWEVFNAELMVANSRHTELIQHFWGQPGMPPTFVEEEVKDSGQPLPINAFTFRDNVNPRAVLFHRNKDGTAIRILRRRLFPQDTKLITVVFHVCAGDIGLAVEHAHWLKGLVRGKKWKHEALLAYDLATPQPQVSALTKTLAQCFESVDTFTYPTPPVPGWPAAPNWAWQHVANKMSHGENPWLWLEADAVVLTPDWLEKIQAAYDTQGKGFLGPVVKGMAHANGVMVYPPNTPDLAPNAMRATDKAWDYIAGPEIQHDCHDASDLFCHLWTVSGEQALPVGGGATAPMNVTIARAERWIPKGSVIVHRIKDTSLIHLLKNGGWKP